MDGKMQLQLLKNFEEDSKWFHNNVDLLREQDFTGKIVAIKGGGVISSGKEMDEVIKDLEFRGENPQFIFMEFVHPEGYTLLL